MSAPAWNMDEPKRLSVFRIKNPQISPKKKVSTRKIINVGVYSSPK